MAAYRERMRAEFERTLQEFMESIDAAPCGCIIRDSAEPPRDLLDRFRQAAYETAIQMKVEAAEAECKTTTHRVKGRGRRWDAANAEGMMASPPRQREHRGLVRHRFYLQQQITKVRNISAASWATSKSP